MVIVRLMTAIWMIAIISFHRICWLCRKDVKKGLHIQYTENAFSIEQIVNIVNLAGFGNGIGSGRSSGYGRYHVEDIR